MNCPYCNSTDTSVIDSREAEDQTSIRRRRECSQCGKRFTTYERVEGIDLKIIKKNGTTENFSREKLKRGIIKATWKRPISMSAIDELIDEVERKLRQRNSCEIKSWEVGNLVINRLRKLDPLSYLLFASVYRDFDSLEDFAEEISKLQTISQENNEEENSEEKNNVEDIVPTNGKVTSRTSVAVSNK